MYSPFIQGGTFQSPRWGFSIFPGGTFMSPEWVLYFPKWAFYFIQGGTFLAPSCFFCCKNTTKSLHYEVFYACFDLES